MGGRGDSGGKYANGTKDYTFFDKYGKRITINDSDYSQARRLAHERGLSHIDPSKRKGRKKG